MMRPMLPRTLITLAFAALLGCPSSEPGPDTRADTTTSATRRAVGRWSVNPDLGLSGLVTGLELSANGQELSGQAYLSGRVVPVRGTMRGDSISLVTASDSSLTIRGQLTGDSIFHATITSGEQRVSTRFVRDR